MCKWQLYFVTMINWSVSCCDDLFSLATCRKRRRGKSPSCGGTARYSITTALLFPVVCVLVFHSTENIGYSVRTMSTCQTFKNDFVLKLPMIISHIRASSSVLLSLLKVFIGKTETVIPLIGIFCLLHLSNITCYDVFFSALHHCMQFGTVPLNMPVPVWPYHSCV